MLKYIRHNITRILLWVAVLVFLPWISTGPLTVIVGFAFLFLTGYRVARWALPVNPMARLPATWLMSCMEVMLIAEFLSLFSLLNSPKSWLLAQVAMDMIVLLVLPRIDKDLFLSFYEEWKKWVRAIRFLSPLLRLLLIIFVVLFLGHLVMAALSGITVYDSVTGYVPVCVKYLQNGSLKIILTDLPHPNPDVVMAVLGWHSMYIYSMALTGSIVLLNVLGWTSTAMGLAATILICRQARLSRGLSVIVSVVAFCAPMAVIQAANTNYDQQAGFAMAATVLFAIIAIKRPKWGPMFLLAVAQVVLTGTKLTAFYILPIVLVLDIIVICRSWRKGGRRQIVWFLGVAILLVLCMILPHFIRTNTVFRQVRSGPRRVAVRTAPETPSLPAVRTVAKKTIAKTDVSFSSRIGSLMRTMKEILTRYTQKPSQAGITFAARNIQLLIPFEISLFKNRSGNSFGVLLRDQLPGVVDKLKVRNYLFRDMITTHLRSKCADPDKASFGALPLILLVLTLVCLIAPSRRRKFNRVQKRVLLLCIGGWLVFMILFAMFFSWTPYNSRYMLLAWFLAAPVFGIVLCARGPRFRFMALTLVMMIGLFENGYWLLNNKNRPISVIMNYPRNEHYIRFIGQQGSAYNIVRPLLEQNHVKEIRYDTHSALFLLYMDDMLKRRLVYTPDLKRDGSEVILTRLLPPIKIPARLYELKKKYGIYYMWGCGPRKGRYNALLVPREIPVYHGMDDKVRVDRFVSDLITVKSISEDDSSGTIIWGGPGHRNIWHDLVRSGKINVHIEADRALNVMLHFKVHMIDDEPSLIQLAVNEASTNRCPIRQQGKYHFNATLKKGGNVLTLSIPDDLKSAQNGKPLYVSHFSVFSDLRYFLNIEGFAPDVLRCAGVRLDITLHDFENDINSHTVWIGPREQGRLQVVLESDVVRKVLVSIAIRQLGPALPDNDCAPLDLMVNGKLSASFKITDITKEYRTPVTLQKGFNYLTLIVPADDDGERYDKDVRACLLKIKSIVVSPPSP